MISRKQKELSEEDITRIGEIYHSWRSKDLEQKFKDIPGLCKSVSIEEIRKNNYVLTPGRYIEFKEDEDDGVDFEEKMKILTSDLKGQFDTSKKLENEILILLKGLGYEL
jgi:type I restriction enzyme M protein